MIGFDLAKIVIVMGALLTAVPFLVYLERKVSAWIQDRRGPNRVGPYGLLQTIADGIKLLFKEDLTPAETDKFLFSLAPCLVFIPPALGFAVIPWGTSFAWGEGGRDVVNLQIADLSVGVLWVLMASSFTVYGLSFGGWASNNKWSLLGGVRASAQMISYEVALGLAVVAVLMTAGSVRMSDIVVGQAAGGLLGWNLFHQPLAFLIFFTAAFAETNRLPFDFPEAEAELVAGYHTEYSSMRFALFFLGEYLAVTAMSALTVTLFLGGWHYPGMNVADHGVITVLLSVAAFSIKTLLVITVFVWVRWTLPRFRYDQLMGLGWKTLIPLALLNLAITGLVGVL